MSFDEFCKKVIDEIKKKYRELKIEEDRILINDFSDYTLDVVFKEQYRLFQESKNFDEFFNKMVDNIDASKDLLSKEPETSNIHMVVRPDIDVPKETFGPLSDPFFNNYKIYYIEDYIEMNQIRFVGHEKMSHEDIKTAANQNLKTLRYLVKKIDFSKEIYMYSGEFITGLLTDTSFLTSLEESFKGPVLICILNMNDMIISRKGIGSYNEVLKLKDRYNNIFDDQLLEYSNGYFSSPKINHLSKMR